MIYTTLLTGHEERSVRAPLRLVLAALTFFLNIFLNDLDISQDDFTTLYKYADNLTICAPVLRGIDW